MVNTLITNAGTDLLKKQLADPATLADVVNGWRNRCGFSQPQAAYFLDVPVRTLQGIEQGRGFRYPVMLFNAMRNLDEDLKRIKRYGPAQMRAAKGDQERATKELGRLQHGDAS